MARGKDSGFSTRFGKSGASADLHDAYVDDLKFRVAHPRRGREKSLLEAIIDQELEGGPVFVWRRTWDRWDSCFYLALVDPDPKDTGLLDGRVSSLAGFNLCGVGHFASDPFNYQAVLLPRPESDDYVAVSRPNWWNPPQRDWAVETSTGIARFNDSGRRGEE